jgi:Glyoxalase-like domain
MVARVDHITVVAPTLEAGSVYVKAALGIAPDAGRKHPHMGTHNLLLALGSTMYLEVISRDPDAAPVPRPRWFGLDHVASSANPRLAAWVANTDDIAHAVAPELGSVETMRRESHTWRMTVRADGGLPFEGAAPLLIQRASNGHPAGALRQSGLSLTRLRIRHPIPEQVLGLLARMELASQPPVVVTWSDRCSLVAEIDTPFGPREIGET